jgi:hypothetical protein
MFVTLAAMTPPEDIYLRIARDSFVVLIIAANVTWYCVKAVLWTRGYKVSFIWHERDLTNLKRLIADEPDILARRRYKLLRTAFYTCLALFIIVPLTFVGISMILSASTH